VAHADFFFLFEGFPRNVKKKKIFYIICLRINEDAAEAVGVQLSARPILPN
jgi:hypothetical protein